jgi:hypothetical protein
MRELGAIGEKIIACNNVIRSLIMLADENLETKLEKSFYPAKLINFV